MGAGENMASIEQLQLAEMAASDRLYTESQPWQCHPVDKPRLDQQGLADLRGQRDAMRSRLEELMRIDIEALLAECEELRKALLDAKRYRLLRECCWDSSDVCVVVNPKSNVRLGTDCPSGSRLDSLLDSKLEA